MPQEGRRPKQRQTRAASRRPGRPKVSFTEDEKTAIAGEFFRQRNAEAAERWEKEVQKRLREDANYGLMEEAHGRLSDFRKTAGPRKLQEARKEASTRVETWAKNKKPLRVDGPARPKLTPHEKSRLAEDVAIAMTKLLGKPVSKTRVLECWETNSYIFNELSRD